MGLMLLITIFSLLCGSIPAKNLDYADQITIETHQAVCKVSENFLSIAIDISFSLKNDINTFLKSKVFMNMLRGLQPAYLRIGGTASDLVIFDSKGLKSKISISSKTLSFMDSLSWVGTGKYCYKRDWPVLHLSKKKWLDLNKIAQLTKLNILFDLNVLTRGESGEWDPTNAIELIDFSQKANLSVDWQLGNEPNSFCHVFGEWISPLQLAKDFETLSKVLKMYPMYSKSKIVGPDITAPRGPQKRRKSTLRYLDKFLLKAKDFINAATWHQYYLNGRNATEEDFMNPEVLETLRREIKDVKKVVMKNTNEHFPLWITETSSAFGGGAPKLSDSYVGGFMWLDKLGLSATYNISTVIRQSFIGGNYGLIDKTTLEPNPDYWVSYLFKTIVGQVVLQLNTTHGSPLVRLYAHCHIGSTAESKKIVIFGMNLGTVEYKGHIITKDSNSPALFDVEKYILTALDGQMSSRKMLLNGEELRITSSGRLPTLKPDIVETKSIELPPRSMGFFAVDGFSAPACN